MSKLKAFENVKNQIGYCGIWCGSCVRGNGSIQELARRFEEIANNQDLKRHAPKDFDFEEFLKGLASLQKMSLCPGCRRGGGPLTCKVRVCALVKGFRDCSQCDQLTECKNFDQLEKTHPGIKEDLAEIKGRSHAALTERWTEELKNKWPHCILLCPSAKK